MIKTAVILTVFNRREVTLKGLRTLYRAFEELQNEQPYESYHFDIYMTDDGCSDGTADAVKGEFPDVHIIQGDGNLYWSGGMRKAWQTAIHSSEKYDFYLWFNDDAELYENALVIMFDSHSYSDKKSIISGAFCDSKGNASYGGRDRKSNILTPHNVLRPIFLMNGNLVRHDNDIEPFLDPKYSLGKRMSLLYSNKHSAIKSFIFCKRHFGIVKALRVIVMQNIYAICPQLYNIRRCIK